MKKIPIIDLKRQYSAIEKPVSNVLSQVLQSQSFILGNELEKAEKNVALYCNTGYAAGVNSGTDALILALKALDIKEKDEVITTPFTFIATAEAIVHAGARPVFVDIDPVTYNINPSLIESKVTVKTKAILPVHLYGLCADMDPILELAKKHNLKVLEDCAQAIGSEYKERRAGSIGDAGAISFYPGKNLGCFGDGGMLVTNDKAICENVKLLRNHGSNERYHHKLIGYNSRLDDLQAAILNIKIAFLDKWIERRIENAEFFNNALRGYPVVTPHIPSGSRHSFHLYVLRTSRAKEITAYLNENGIEARVYYPIPLHLQECFRFLGYRKGDFPEAEKLAMECLAIPVYPELTSQEKEHMVNKIKGFFERR